MPEERVCLGVIVGARGLRGEVKVKSFAAVPDDVAAYGPVSTEDGSRHFALTVVGAAKGVVVCRVTGVTDRTAAEALKGERLYVARDVLPSAEEDEFYHADLIGLAVLDEDGTDIGTVTALYDFGAGDVVEIALGRGKAKGRSVMVPFTRAAVPTVDIKAGRVVVTRQALEDAEAAGDEAGPKGDDGAMEKED